jgi:hypothetical protein
MNGRFMLEVAKKRLLAAAFFLFVFGKVNIGSL